jgi:iron complex outermembrane receptor protein
VELRAGQQDGFAGPHPDLEPVRLLLLKWKNIQQDINLSDAGFDYETNVGRRHQLRLEAELKARVTQQLTLSASAGVTHATFSADQLAFGTNADGLANAPKGAMLPGVPKGSASLGADYHWAVGDAASAFLRGNEQWTGYSHGIVFASSADYSRKAYYTTDLSGGISLDKWEFTAFIKNANNDHTAIQHPNVQGIDEAYYLRPRTLGISGNYEF